MPRADTPMDRRSGTVLAFPRPEPKLEPDAPAQGLAAENVLSCCRSILNGAADRLERNLVNLGELMRRLPDSSTKSGMEQQRRQIAVQLFLLRRMLAGL